MRFVFFDDYRLGRIHDDHVHDVTSALGDLSGLSPQERLLALIARYGEAREAIRAAAKSESSATYPLAGLRLRASVPYPAKLICAARNYRELGHHTTSLPIEFFLKSPDAILDPEGTVVLPPHEAKVFHHEAELALVIGKTAKNVAPENALDYVFGYTPFCDVSARGLVGGFFIGKSFDTFAPIGPVLVTADEVPNPQALHVELDVNGEPRQRFGTDDMANDVRALIAHASSICTLRPGDVIATGTNHQALSPIQEGDRVEIRIEDWPPLRFSVHDPANRSWERVIDPEMAARARQTGPVTGRN